MGAQNTIKVIIMGENKSGKALKSFGQDLSTVHGRLSLFGKALASTFTGHFERAGKQFGALSKAGRITGGVFGFVTNMAGKVGAALPYVGAVAVGLVGAFTGVVLAVNSVIQAFGAWAGAALQMSQVTGMTTRDSSVLLGTFDLLGVNASKAGTSIAMFTKTLGGAQKGVKANAEAFKMLGINVKGLTAGAALPLVAAKLQGIKSASERAYIASKLFGRGWQSLTKYLLAGKKTLSDDTQKVKDLGLEMGPKAMRTFAAYHKAQTQMSLSWQAIKIAAGNALAPIASTFLNAISKWIIKNMPAIKSDFNTWAGLAEQLEKPLGQAASKIAAAITWLINPDHQKAVEQFFSKAIAGAEQFASQLSIIVSGLSAAMSLLKNFNSTPVTSHAGTLSHGTKALGGPTFGPTTGYLMTLHGRETVVSHKAPSSGLADLADSGLLGGGAPQFQNCTFNGAPPEAWLEAAYQHGRVRSSRGARRTARNFGMAYS